MDTFLKILFAILLAIGISITVGGWVVMITAGMIHHEVASLATAIPAWSFRESVFVAIGLTVLGSFFKDYPKRD